MKKLELEKAEKRKRRFSALTCVIIVATVLLSVAQLILSNRLAGYSEELAILSEREKALAFENELRAKEIASESAIATIAQKAQIASMSAASQYLVVEERESVAALRDNAL